MIGDNLDTDVRLGINGGIDTLCVLTGNSSEEMVVAAQTATYYCSTLMWLSIWIIVMQDIRSSLPLQINRLFSILPHFLLFVDIFSRLLVDALTSFQLFVFFLLWRVFVERADDQSVVFVFYAGPKLLGKESSDDLFDLIFWKGAELISSSVFIKGSLLNSLTQTGSNATQVMVPVGSVRSREQLYLKLKEPRSQSGHWVTVLSTFFLQSLHIL